MKHILIALFSALAFISGIYGLYKPLGRELIPQIAPFFVGDRGIWGTIKNATESEADILEIKALKNDVRIARDEFGIPHIYASNYDDALFGLGYITGRDRLFQLELQSRLIAGETAEWFGKSHVEIDKFMLNLGLDKVSSELISSSYNTKEYELLRTFSAGVNAYINSEAEQIRPFEYALLGLNIRYHRPVDGIRAMLWYHFLMNFSLDDFKVQEIVNKIGNDAFYDVFFQESNHLLSPDGSKLPDFNKPKIPALNNSEYKNTFALLTKQMDLLERVMGWSPGMLKSNTLIYNNSVNHKTLAYSATGPITKPNLFYEVYLHIEGEIIHGFTIPGIPGILFGNNNNVAWTVNSTPLNVVDFKQVSDSVQIVNELGYSIEVRETSTVNYSVRFTKDGALLASGTELLELSWPAIKNGEIATGLMKATFSSSLNELKQAFSNASFPVTQITGFDYSGIGYFLSSSIPIRNQYLGIVSKKEYEKQENKLFSPELFKVIKGSSLAYANQYPINGSIKKLPYFSRQGLWRSIRLHELSKSIKPPVDQKTLSDLLNDKFMVESKLQPIFTELFKGKINSPINSLGNQLRNWNYIADKDASYPKFFSNFEKILPNLIYDEFPIRFFPDYDIIIQNLTQKPNDKWFDQVQTENKESGRDILLKAFYDAYDLSVLESGAPENWTWAVTNRGRVKHISNNDIMNRLNESFVIREGASNTVFQNYDDGFSYAPTLKFTVELKDNVMESRALLFSGNSANRYSRFYENQMANWVGNDLRPRLNFMMYDSLYKQGYLILKSSK